MNINNNRFKVLKDSYSKIPLVDKCLIVFMLVLLIQLGYSLFFSSQATEEFSSIDVIVRTSTASIFGYFLSANFIKHKQPEENQQPTASKDKVINIGNEQDVSEHTITPENVNKIGFRVSATNSTLTSGSTNIDLAQQSEAENSTEVIVENKMQIIIATSMGLFCLVSLLVLRNISDWNPNFESSSSTAATIAQFRDFVSGCVGFLIGCPSNSSRNK